MNRKNHRIMVALTSFLLISCFTYSYGENNPQDYAIHENTGIMAADTCDGQLPGDLNGNGIVKDVFDLVLLVDFLCNAGPPPFLLSNADLNGDCVIDVLDLFCMQDAFCNPVECTCVNPIVGSCNDTCASQYPGDVNNSGGIDISDLIYLVDFMFRGGPPSDPPSNADVQGDCTVNIADLTYLVDYMFTGGPPPVECTCVHPEYSETPTISINQLCDENPALRQILDQNYNPVFTLDKNYPNPFNPTTQISFNLTSESHVTMEVFNISGQLVTTLLDRVMQGGHHTISWDGKTDNDAPAASGIYLYRVTADGISESKRMMLLK